MRWIGMLLALLMGCSDLAAQVFKWTDANGTVHFSDRPPAGQVKTQEMNSVVAQVTPELRYFCTRLRNLLPNMLGFASRGSSRSQSMQAAESSEAKLREMGVDRVHLRRLVDAIYGYDIDQGRVDGMRRAVDDIHSRCMSGAYGSFKADAEAGDRQDTDARPGNSGKVSGGTGFLIAANLVATSLHVVDGSKNITLHLSDGSQLSANVVNSNRGKDLAILKLQQPTKLRYLRVASDTVGLGAEVFTIGFPQTSLMGIEPKLATGVISATSGIQDDGRAYQISVPVQAGNSGGPLVDGEGRVVGVVAAKLNAAKVFEWTGDLPQNVNYAAKSTYLAGMMPVDALRAGEPVAGDDVQTKAATVRIAVVRIEAR